jgi:dipeptidyl-peptidase 4
MKLNLKQVLAFCFIVTSAFSGVTFSYGQMPRRGGNQIAVTGWADDSHYLFKSFDENKNLVTRIVDVKSGKSSVYVPEPPVRDQINAKLPQGTTLAPTDVINPDSRSAVLSKDNDLYLFTVSDGQMKRLTNDKVPEVNVHFSPDGSKIAYTRNKDLYVFDLSAGKETRLTSDAADRIYNGYSSWVYYEEILGRASHYTAFWWSPDGNRIAYLRTDETEVPLFTLNRLDEPDGLHGLIEAVPYPLPGDPNPKVKMGIADLATGKTTWVKTDYSVDQYIAWPFWTNDGSKLAIQVLNRDQNDMRFILADPSTGEFTQIYDESRKTWVEFFEDIYVMKNGSGFIVRSSRNDWSNLYLWGWDGKMIRQLTNVSFVVSSIEKVDEDAKAVYFYATGTESTDRHLFRVGLDGRNLVQLTSEAGTHSASISPKGTYIADTWSSVANPGSIILLDKKGKKLKEIYDFSSQKTDPSKNSRAELVRIGTADGLFSMPAIITYPMNFNPSAKYPVVFTIYGGPGSRNVSNSWQGNTPSWYAQNDIITFTVDHRGSGQFGMKGMDWLYRNLGKWETSDYSDAVKWLRTKAFIDSTKIGITGTSYGGYMTCMALTKGAGFWTHGVAGMPVTDYRLYDNIYTERYMDTPKDNAEGYRETSAVTWVKNFSGKLLLYHADMDDNVHMQNSIWFISKMQDEGKDFEFMLYPDGRHGWGGPKATYVRSATNKFWLKNFFNK